jgi:hypothetical protein
MDAIVETLTQQGLVRPDRMRNETTKKWITIYRWNGRANMVKLLGNKKEDKNAVEAVKALEAAEDLTGSSGDEGDSGSEEGSK